MLRKQNYISNIINRAGLLFLCALLFAKAGMGQDDLSTITQAFNNYNAQNLHEKIFVHTDKDFYVAGEIIWFKLYDVDAIMHKPLGMSKVAYIEILDSANKPVLQGETGLVKGDGNGSFFLPLTINSGNYTLRAYTNWMRNSDAAYYFQKNITIINTQKIADITIADTTTQYDISFFPEGGNLVNNLQSRVAFKGIAQNGKSIAFTGALMDNADTLLRFNSEHGGMGSFYFTPLTGHVYKAVIKPPTGDVIVKAIPTVYATGYVMNVAVANDSLLRVTVHTNTDDQQVYLLVHSCGLLKIARTAVLKNGVAVFDISRSLPGDGISQLTIFNSNRQPVCERLWFKPPGQQLKIALTADQPYYTKRKPVNISIETGGTGIKGDSASMSMAVYRLDSLQSAAGGRFITSCLLLTSDIKGFVEDPEYYFSAPAQEASIAADNLMLTNGWRRFKWENILSNAKPVFSFPPEYKGKIISGQISNSITGLPAREIETYLSAPGLNTLFTTSVSDSNGLVKYELKDFYASSGIVVQTNPQRDSIYRIAIDNPFSSDFSTYKPPAFTMPASSPNTLLGHSISMQVQNIYSADKLKQLSLPATADTTAFYLHPDAHYNLDDFTRFTTLEEDLREYIALVNVSRREGHVHFPVYDLSGSLTMKEDPLVLVDGVPMFNLDRFLKLDVFKLKSVDVVNRKYLLGGTAFYGILNWKTYKGDPADYPLDPHALAIDYDGLQLQREFYAPAYTTEAETQTHLPDFRNVLYWTPNIKMPAAAGRVESFYTSDLPGKYAVVVQGITQNGICGSKVVYFTVRE